jgi:hypothetical protein
MHWEEAAIEPRPETSTVRIVHNRRQHALATVFLLPVLLDRTNRSGEYGVEFPGDHIRSPAPSTASQNINTTTKQKGKA